MCEKLFSPVRHRIPAGAGAVAGPVITEGHGPGDLRGRLGMVRIARVDFLNEKEKENF
jgi:hypothetical protein